MSDRKRSECLKEAEFVSLLYDELSEADRFPLDEHLAGCSTCVDEFATLSEARLCAYEWNRDEFAHLATPAVEIPYRHKATGWFRRAFAGFSALSQLGAASAAAAVLAVTLVGGYFLFAGSGEQNNVAEKRAEPAAARSPAVIEPSERKTSTPEKPEVRDVENFVAARPAERKVKVVATVRKPAFKPSARPDVAATKVSRPQIKSESLVARQQAAPRLTSNAELSDDSLRLADLFSELDANE